MPCPSIATQFQALLTSLLRVLFSFRSLYYCAIGFKIYLVLEDDVPHIHARLPTHVTLDSATSNFHEITGLSPTTVYRSRIVNPTNLGLKDGSTPHLQHFTVRIRFGLCRFRSPLLAASQLISLPAPTQMFQLRAFPTLNGSPYEMVRVLIRKSRDQRLHAPSPGLSQLGTSFFGS
jgi:hypothetical protein